jgi:hypothetical protein
MFDGLVGAVCGVLLALGLHHISGGGSVDALLLLVLLFAVLGAVLGVVLHNDDHRTDD